MKLHYKIIEQGTGPNNMVPLNIVFIDKRDIEACAMAQDDAIKLVAKGIHGPAGINIFDMDAITTSSDGLVIQGAIVKMAASDNGKVNKEFGILEMEEMEVTDELIAEEPHLIQCRALYDGKKLFRGPNPSKKLIPVHNAVMTGRAVNNNSATEMMNVVTMEEILLPILGQLEIMKEGNLLMGMTGEHISVGIGMTVAEKFGRVFPTRQFKAGETAHGSGEYAKTLKQHIPCIVAAKSVLAQRILDALKVGMIPGKHIGCSPAVLAVAKTYGAEIGFEHITEQAQIELESVGMIFDELKVAKEPLTEDEIIKHASSIIPGVNDPIEIHSSEIVMKKYIEIEC